jgi:hypothetical protein
MRIVYSGVYGQKKNPKRTAAAGLPQGPPPELARMATPGGRDGITEAGAGARGGSAWVPAHCTPRRRRKRTWSC